MTAVEVAETTTQIIGAADIKYPPITSSLTESPSVVYIDGRVQPPWLAAVIGRIDELMSLDPEWDGGTGTPVRSADALDALEFLRAVMTDDIEPPWIAPLVTGGLELSWRRPDLEVEAVFDGTRDDQIVLVTDHGEDWDAPPYQAVPLFRAFAGRLRVAE